MSEKQCLFCGGTPLHKEHVFPKWLSRALQRRGAQMFTMRTHRGPWNAREVNLQTRTVCRDCNNGWMHKLEEDVKPVLERMLFDDHPPDLSVADRKVLATWTVKTALILIAWQEPGQLSTEPYEALRSDLSVENRALVLAALRGPDDHDRYFRYMVDHIPNDDPSLPAALRVDIAIGRIVLRVIALLGDRGGAVDLTTRENVFALIWPIAAEPRPGLEWPPPRLLTDSELEAIFRIQHPAPFRPRPTN